MQDYSGLSVWGNVIPTVLIRGRQEGQPQRRRCEDGKRSQRREKLEKAAFLAL